VGRAFGVDIGDVGSWADEEDLLFASFYDECADRPRSFAAVVDAIGRRLTWWEAS
jgi:hypothetical protein